MVTTAAYPLYDTHGNMVATLTKNASGTSWNVGNERAYDVWGGVRSGAATGGPKGRYCGNEPVSRIDPYGRGYIIEIDGWFIGWDKVGNNAPGLADFAFGKDRRCNMGSYRLDGMMKHDYGHRLPKEVLEKLGQNKSFRNWLKTAVNSRAGVKLLPPGPARDSATATFNHDPWFVIGLFVVNGTAKLGGDSNDMWAPWI